MTILAQITLNVQALVCGTISEITNKIHEMVKGDGKLKMRDIASAMGISKERVHNIFNQHFNIKSYPRNECRDCSQITKIEIVSRVSSTVCSYFNEINLTLIVVWSLRTKHEYTIT